MSVVSKRRWLLETNRTIDADWHDLGMHVHWRVDAGVELTLMVQAVLDPVPTLADRRHGEIFVVLQRKRSV
jgi:hypothetical protein